MRLTPDRRLRPRPGRLRAQRLVVQPMGDTARQIGFLRAAWTLSEYGEVGLRDLYAFAIGALYRHAVELQLKVLAQSVREALQITIDRTKVDARRRTRIARFLRPNAPSGHDLKMLLDYGVAALGLLDGAPTLSPTVHKTISAFHDFDPTNEAFRYAMKRNGQAPTVTRRLDVAALGKNARIAFREMVSAQNYADVAADQLRPDEE